MEELQKAVEAYAKAQAGVHAVQMTIDSLVKPHKDAIADVMSRWGVVMKQAKQQEQEARIELDHLAVLARDRGAFGDSSRLTLPSGDWVQVTTKPYPVLRDVAAFLQVAKPWMIKGINLNFTTLVPILETGETIAGLGLEKDAKVSVHIENKENEDGETG